MLPDCCGLLCTCVVYQDRHPITCLLVLFLSLCGQAMNSDLKSKILREREMVLQAEGQFRIGSHVVLSDREEQANRVLMSFKQREIKDSRKSFGKPFIPSLHYFKGKSLIENSEVYKIIRKMPKGGILHLHSSVMVDVDWLVSNVTYMSHCYMCTDCRGHVFFHFFLQPPSNPECPWKLVFNEREASGNRTIFDQMLYNSMSMFVDDPEIQYPTTDHAWQKLEQVVAAANGLVKYAPVLENYFYEGLAELDEDNIQYVEIRGRIPETYDLYGNTNNRSWTMKTYVDTLKRFIEIHPGFIGGKFILSGHRTASADDVLKNVKTAIQLMEQFPEYVAGFDLVGQEDHGKPLLSYIDALLYPSRLDPPVNLPYFFHAGETYWEGTPTDSNLIDAVLLNTTRIGHGYALTKHPQVLKMIKERDIAIEVNPISNQVLSLVKDLRNHPAASLIADGYPVVIASDGPSAWGVRGQSYDFYMAFMGLAGADADLKFLKQIAINSLKYSAMSSREKESAIASWRDKWKQFINEILSIYSNNG